MMKLSFDIPTTIEEAEGFSDEYLAFAWQCGQFNRADIDDQAASALAETIGREIIRRWISSKGFPLWLHQGTHYYWSILKDHGSWLPVDTSNPNGERRWVPYPPKKLDPESPCRVGMHHFEGGVCKDCGEWQDDKNVPAERRAS